MQSKFYFYIEIIRLQRDIKIYSNLRVRYLECTKIKYIDLTIENQNVQIKFSGNF